MKAIILAAGYGNRMRPLTNSKHKTLLKINEVTILNNIIDSLIKNKVHDICIVTGYRHNDIIDYLDSKYMVEDFKYIYNEDYKTTNNIYSLALAFENILIDDDILLIESDLIFEHHIISDLISDANKNVALVGKYQSGMDGTVVKIGDDKQILEVIPPHLQDIEFNFKDKYKTLNIYKFSKSFCKSTFSTFLTYYAKVINNNCYYELVLGMLIYMQQEKIYASIVENESWIEVDDTNDIRIAEFKFAKDRAKRDILNKSWGGYWNYNITDYCFIRNMYFPTQSMIAEAKNNFDQLIWNYGSSNEIVNTKMSNFLLVNNSNIVALNGASQIFPFIKAKYGHQKALIPSPTFGEYDRIFDNKTYYDGCYNHTQEDFLKLIEENQVIVIVNPNNPTGSVINSSDIIKYADNFQEKLFIIDESFIDFSDICSVIAILEEERRDNIIVVRSMSKSHGFPGVRLGYVYSTCKDIIGDIKKYIPIWNFNSIAEYFLEIMLKYRNQFKESINRTKKDRKNFTTMLANSQWVDSVMKSEANFILVQTKKEINKVADILLEKHNIYIRDISNKYNNPKTYFRFAVRTNSENESLVKLINDSYEYIKRNN